MQPGLLQARADHLSLALRTELYLYESYALAHLCRCYRIFELYFLHLEILVDILDQELLYGKLRG